jgi:hypothetical protein
MGAQHVVRAAVDEQELVEAEDMAVRVPGAAVRIALAGGEFGGQLQQAVGGAQFGDDRAGRQHPFVLGQFAVQCLGQQPPRRQDLPTTHARFS